MASIWAWVRALLRAARVTTAALAVLTGLAGGVVLAATAGAIRTDTAVARFLDATDAPDAVYFGREDVLDQVVALPQVRSATRISFLGMQLLDSAGHPDRTRLLNPVAVMADPARPPRRQAMVLAGREADQDQPDEVTINDHAARALGLHVGSVIQMVAYSQDQLGAWLQGEEIAPAGPRVTVRVVGILRWVSDLSTSSVPAGVAYLSLNQVVFTTAFYAERRDEVANFGVALKVALHAGPADFPAWRSAVRALAGPDAEIGAGSDERSVAQDAMRSTHVAAIGLWLFAGLAGLSMLVVLGQSIGRQLALDAAATPVLSAIGVTPTQVVAGLLVRPAVIAGAGGVLAAGTAVALSPLTPIGLARQAEIHPGAEVNVAVLGAGVAAILVVLIARATLTAVRLQMARRVIARNAASSPSRLAERAAVAGAGPATVSGLRLAFGRRPAGTVAPGPALAGITIAVAAVVAALTFGASLRHLAATPSLQGWTWDVAVGNPHTQSDITAGSAPALVADRAIDAIAGITGEVGGVVRLGPGGGVDMAAVGIQQLKGTVGPSIVEGRAPAGAGEVALGPLTLRALHLHVGDAVTASGNNGAARFRVVGAAVISPVVVNSQIRLGQGAVFTVEGLRRLSAEAPANQFLIRFRAGADRTAALARLEAAFPLAVVPPVLPAEVENLWQVRALPAALAALLAALAAGSLVHLLVTSLRTRRREFALLRAAGFVRRQVGATMAWQSTALTAVAVTAGIPLGIAGGRAAWEALAHQMGIGAAPVVPAVAIASAVPLALGLANLLAALPGRLAARARVATALRAE